jgi:uncharacterized protein (DUF433 family)
VAVACGWAGRRRVERISTDPAVCHGRPCAGRTSRSSSARAVGVGLTVEEIAADFPDLARDDLRAALELAALVSGRRRMVPAGIA